MKIALFKTKETYQPDTITITEKDVSTKDLQYSTWPGYSGRCHFASCRADEGDFFQPPLYGYAAVLVVFF
jgi:hypothetical protein